jgi:hypothetical protein
MVAIVEVATTFTIDNQGNQEVNGKLSNHGIRDKNVTMVTIT